MRAMAAALTLLLAWSLFAFGAVYDWSFIPAAILAAVGAGVTFVNRSPRGWLDWALIATAAASLLQLVPLPESLRLVLAPAQSDYLARISLVSVPTEAWRPLTLYPDGWLFGAGVVLASLATFFWARDAFASRGVRRLARHLAWMGLVVSAIALVHPALFPDGRIYGFWTPIASSAHPTGPIVSRNHFAAWIVLAWPLTIGYLIAHGRTHWQDRRTSRMALILGDMRALWLVLAAAAMLAALLITESRSGVIGFAAASVMLVTQLWSRLPTTGRVGLVGLLALVALGVSLWASPDAVMNRFEHAYSGVDGGRPEIWSQAMTLVRLFPITGVGLGAFEVVMPAYQTASFATLLNHAHNQYLHVLAEGGVLVMAPVTCAAVLFLVAARRALREERTPVLHVRQGALSGLIGLGVLSIFEVPLLTPAVAFLGAVCAALVVRRATGEDA